MKQRRWELEGDGEDKLLVLSLARELRSFSGRDGAGALAERAGGRDLLGTGRHRCRGAVVARTSRPGFKHHYKPRASATGERASAWATRAKVNVGRRGISATATLLGTGLFYVFGSDADAEALNTDSC